MSFQQLQIGRSNILHTGAIMAKGTATMLDRRGAHNHTVDRHGFEELADDVDLGGTTAFEVGDAAVEATGGAAAVLGTEKPGCSAWCHAGVCTIAR